MKAHKLSIISRMFSLYRLCRGYEEAEMTPFLSSDVTEYTNLRYTNNKTRTILELEGNIPKIK